MPLTPSTMLPLGTAAPRFTLYDVISQKELSLENLKSPLATVIMFICNHCPYVKHIEHQLAAVAKSYQAKNIQFIAICANDANHYPADAPAKLAERAAALAFSFPYLYDEDQSVAKAYQAACTPDFFVFDKHLKCVYRGRFDDASPGNSNPVTGKSLTAALDCILAGKNVPAEQIPSIGCNIKWKT